MGGNANTCTNCDKEIRTDHLNRHFNTHVKDIIFNMKPVRRQEHLTNKDPVLVHLSGKSQTIEQWAYCTVCHIGRFVHLRGHFKQQGDIEKWAEDHKNAGCGAKFGNVARLFETPEPPKERKEPIVVKKQTVVVDTTKISKLEERIAELETENETLKQAEEERDKFIKFHEHLIKYAEEVSQFTADFCYKANRETNNQIHSKYLKEAVNAFKQEIDADPSDFDTKSNDEDEEEDD